MPALEVDPRIETVCNKSYLKLQEFFISESAEILNEMFFSVVKKEILELQ